jgi:hypothetical protein
MAISGHKTDSMLRRYAIISEADQHRRSLVAGKNSDHPEAANEFQKMLDHRGILINSPLASLAHSLAALTFSTKTRTKPAPRTKTSSPSGKTPTPTFPS